jgi:chloramphenicol-sensitive protein RarD
MQFFLGFAVLDEPMPTNRWIGFGFIWLALAIFTQDALRNRKPAN